MSTVQTVPVQRPPGPQGHWLKGSLPEYRAGRLQFYERLRRDYGTTFAFRIGPYRLAMLCEPDAIRDVLVTRNKEFGRSFSTKMLKDFFGNGLLISEGDVWLRDRRVIQPTFAKEQIASYAEPMARQTVDYLRDWQAGETRDALLDMQSLTMAIAAETLLGVHLEDEVQAIHEPHELIRCNFDRRMESMFTLPRWIPTPYNRRVTAANSDIRRIVDRLIAERKASGQFGADILSRLLVVQQTMGSGMSDVQIRNQALTFLFAGHETTASMLGWVWYLLSKHPQYERKLHEEVDRVLAGRAPTLADVPQLTFTDKVVRETLRLYPSAYVMGRRVMHDCEIDGYRYQRGTSLVISPWLMQRDERFYDRPLEFDPDRWTPEFEDRLDQFAWFPFGAGPRICIGKGFAMLESVLIVAAIAARYRLELLPGQKISPHPSVTIRPHPGINVKVVAR